MIEYYESLSNTQILREFDREIDPHKQGDLMAWIDKKYNGLWTREWTLMDDACMEYSMTRNEKSWARAKARYFKMMIDFLPEFRRAKGLDETGDFLNSFVKQETL